MAGIRGVPIAAGASGPLLGALRTAPGVHGESALDGAELPSGDDVPLEPDHALALRLLVRAAGEREDAARRNVFIERESRHEWVAAAGLGLAAPMWVAVALSFAGMAIFALSVRAGATRQRAAPRRRRARR